MLSFYLCLPSLNMTSIRKLLTLFCSFFPSFSFQILFLSVHYSLSFCYSLFIFQSVCLTFDTFVNLFSFLILHSSSFIFSHHFNFLFSFIFHIYSLSSFSFQSFFLSLPFMFPFIFITNFIQIFPFSSFISIFFFVYLHLSWFAFYLNFFLF